MRLAGAGLGVDVPAGWDARIYTRPLSEPGVLPQPEASPFSRQPITRGGTASLHAASFPLPREDGDFGTGATSDMPPSGAFVALLEYESGGGLEPGVGLFEAIGPPAPLRRDDLAPDALLRARPGQKGAQRFFTADGRPFCLYVVVGSAAVARTLPDVNRLLASLRFSPVPRVG